MNLIIQLIVSLLIFLLSLLLYAISAYKKRVDAIQKLGIPYQGGVGRLLRFMTGSMSLVQLEDDIYKDALTANASIVGVSDLSGQPSFLIMDLELLKSIYVKDFEHFVNRRMLGSQQSGGAFKKMLFFMENEQWKGTRAKLSPAFTTGKMRRMFEIFKKSSERLEVYIKDQIEFPKVKSVDMDLRPMLPKYTLDVIASVAFGVDSQSFDVRPGQMSVFEGMVKKFGFSFSGKMLLKFMLIMGAPKVADFFGVDMMDYESQQYFARIIRDVVRRRRETGERREDFLQLLMDVQKGMLKADEETSLVMNGVEEEGKGSLLVGEEQKKVTLDDEQLVANGLMFLMAGSDPTQGLVLFTIYALAVEPEVQEKVYNEITSVLSKNGGQITWEAMIEMTYLDMVLNETIRRFAPSGKAERICNKDYPVPGTNIVIEKGSIVLIPIPGFHHDPNHFPDPEKFIPERFTPENKAARHPFAFMPFGHGPRNCIGMRFALIKVKTAIAQMVCKFQYAPCSKTKIPMEYDQSFKPKGDMWLNVTVRE